MRARLISSLALAVAGTLTLAGIAFADNWGSNTASAGTPAHPCDTTINSQCVSETNLVPIEFGAGLSSVYQNAINFAISYYDANTAIYPYISALPANQVTTVLQTNAGNNGAWAWGRCTSSPPATYGGADPYRWCRGSLLYWNTYYAPNKNAVACHEVGHLGGLRHSTDSSGTCMYIAPTTVTHLDAHDISLLALHY